MRDYDKDVLKKAARSRVRKLARCRECMNPLMLRALLNWHDGVITLRFIDNDFRLAFLENDMLGEVMNLLVEQFGEEKVFETARNVEKGSATAYVSTLLLADRRWAVPITYLLKNTPLVDYLMEMSVCFLGYGSTEATVKKLPYGGTIVRNPYSTILFPADVEACYTVARDVEISMTVDPVSEDDRIYMYFGKAEGERRPHLFRRYLLKTAPVEQVEEPHEFRKCPACGVPEPIGRFWWEARMGVIEHRDTEKRIILWPCYALERLLGALEERLGGEAGELIFNTVKKYQRESISSGGAGLTAGEELEFIEAEKEDQYRLLLRHMAAMGFGHGEASLEDHRIEIKMVNPLVPTVASGLIAGMVEALEGRPYQVSWEKDRVATRFSLEPG